MQIGRTPIDKSRENREGRPVELPRPGFTPPAKDVPESFLVPRDGVEISGDGAARNRFVDTMVRRLREMDREGPDAERLEAVAERLDSGQLNRPEVVREAAKRLLERGLL